MTGCLDRTLALMLGGAARLLPPSRRHWAEAVRAEAKQLPAGWPRLGWLAGGLLLVAREGNVARKTGYWLGAGMVSALVAWTVWQSWQAVPAADSESAADRVRVLVGLAALIVLPWVGRRRGVFGPVGTSIAARLFRVVGCAAIWGLGAIIVHLDSHKPTNGIGNGHFDLAQEITGLALLVATLAAPSFMRARWPKLKPEVLWPIVAGIGITALLLVPLQTISVGYLAMILAATSRRSPIAPRTLVIGAMAGLPAGLLFYEVPRLIGEGGWGIFFILTPIVLLSSAAAGAAAAWLTTGSESPEGLRSSRIRQGIFAGVTAGALSGLVPTFGILFFAIMMVLGPLIGLGGGALGAGRAADNPLRSRRDGLTAAGLFVSNS